MVREDIRNNILRDSRVESRSRPAEHFCCKIACNITGYSTRIVRMDVTTSTVRIYHAVGICFARLGNWMITSITTRYKLSCSNVVPMPKKQTYLKVRFLYK